MSKANDFDAVVMREHTLAKHGDHVFYDGKEGKVLALSHIFDGTPTLDLEDVDNPENTCTAIGLEMPKVQAVFNIDA